MSVTQRLRTVSEPVWRSMLEHRFVLAIGEGSVDMQRFGFWVRQDYLFLIDYSRLFALAAARAPDHETMTAFARLCDKTLSNEMALHRAYASEFGISETELQSEAKAPETAAYCDFLLRTASLGDYVELVAALLPCMWGFNEIGLALAAKGLPEQRQCRAWIEMYASPEFTQLTSWCREILDRLATGLPEPALRRLEAAFVTSSRHELAFWDMAAG